MSNSYTPCLHGILLNYKSIKLNGNMFINLISFFYIFSIGYVGTVRNLKCIKLREIEKNTIYVQYFLIMYFLTHGIKKQAPHMCNVSKATKILLYIRLLNKTTASAGSMIVINLRNLLG